MWEYRRWIVGSIAVGFCAGLLYTLYLGPYAKTAVMFCYAMLLLVLEGSSDRGV